MAVNISLPEDDLDNPVMYRSPPRSVSVCPSLPKATMFPAGPGPLPCKRKPSSSHSGLFQGGGDRQVVDAAGRCDR